MTKFINTELESESELELESDIELELKSESVLLLFSQDFTKTLSNFS